MNSGRFSYHSNKHEEALIKELIQELSFKFKTDFFNTVLYDKPINISFTDSERVPIQTTSFKPNAEQIKNFDNYFISSYSKAENSLIDLSDCLSIDDYMSVLKTLKPTHSQYINICLETLERILNKFDFDIATPEITQLAEDDSYIKSINDRITKTLKMSGERKQKDPIINDIASIKKQVENHPENDFDYETKRVIKSCLQTIKLIKEMKKSNGEMTHFDSALSKIQKTITGLSNPKKQYTNFDFLIEKLLNMNICSYSNTKEQLEIIEPFLENMKALNLKIRACHLSFNDKKLDKKEKIKVVYELRKFLFLIITKQYNLIEI